MTSFATIAAALPLALAIGPGAETRVPMALAVIGGVIVSTMLTLVVVPAVYQLLSRFERRAVEPPPTGELAESESAVIG
jgi:multidrug efflux pump subunit AcrB